MIGQVQPACWLAILVADQTINSAGAIANNEQGSAEERAAAQARLETAQTNKADAEARKRDAEKRLTLLVQQARESADALLDDQATLLARLMSVARPTPEAAAAPAGQIGQNPL